MLHFLNENLPNMLRFLNEIHASLLHFLNEIGKGLGPKAPKWIPALHEKPYRMIKIWCDKSSRFLDG